MSVAKEVRLVDIDSLVLNLGTQMRPCLNDEVLSEYEEAMSEGVEFPPVCVVECDEGMVLWDGFHRVEACRRAGNDKILAEVAQGTLRDAVLLATAANARAPLRRDYETVRRSIATILSDPEWSKWSMRAIASHVGCSFGLVKKVKNEHAAAQELLSRPIEYKFEAVPHSADEDEDEDEDGCGDHDEPVAGTSVPRERKKKAGKVDVLRESEEITSAPLANLLEGEQRELYLDAAELYLALRPIKEELRNALKTRRPKKRHGMPEDPYSSLVARFIMAPHPKDWHICKGSGSGCTGVHCRCRGRGFLIGV